MIVGCIMTLNNEIYIENALKSLSSVSDRIVVVDGGSTDSTIDVCRDYTDEIIINKWPGNHSEQRNVYLDYVKRNYPNSWCFSLDSDETIDVSKAKVIIELSKSETIKYYWFKRKWVVNLNPTTYISSQPHFPDWQLRLFRVNSKTEYHGLIHEGVSERSLFNKIVRISYVKSASRKLIEFANEKLNRGYFCNNIVAKLDPDSVTRKIEDFDIWHLDLILNSYNKRRDKAKKYEKIEAGSGGWEYYLPEDLKACISYTQEPKAKLIINKGTL